jgi:DNA-binding protein YbaB
MTSFDPNESRGVVRRDIATAQQRAAAKARAKADVAVVRGRGHSRGGEVSVEVDAAGGLTDVQLTDDAMELRAPDLAWMIRETAELARRDAAARARAVARAAFSEVSSITEQLGVEPAERQS